MNRSRVTADLASHGNIFVDIANDRVGIGSTIPTDKVDIDGGFKLHDRSGFDNHITYGTNPPTITFPSGNPANLAKTPTLVFGDRTSGGDFKIYQDFYSLHMRHFGPSGLHIGSVASHIQISGSNGSNNTQASIRIDAGANEGVKLYSGGTQRFETVGYGVTVLGTTETQELNVTGVTTTSDDINLANNKKVKFGTMGFQIYQNTSPSNNAIIQQSAAGQFLRLITNGGALSIESDYVSLRNSTNSTQTAIFDADGKTSLYHNSNLKFTTESNGVNVTGNLVADCINSIDPDSYTNHFITGAIQDGSGWSAQGIAFGQGTGKMAAFGVSNSLYMAHGDGSNANSLTTFMEVSNAGRVKLHYNGSGKFETSSTGINVTGDITCTSDLILDSTNTDYPRITLHSNASGIRKYAIINGQGWNQDALLIYDIDGDNTRLTIEPNGLGINRGANSISHGLDVGGTAMIRGDIDGTGDLTLTDTTADSAAGPEFKLFRNSASPADADYLGQIKFAGESDTGVERNYAKITGKILDASNGTEDGIIEFAHIKAGSQVITGRFRSDSLQLLNGTQLTVAGTTTLNSPVTINTSTNEQLILSGSSSPYIQFQEGTTNKAYIQWSQSGYFQLGNEEAGEVLRLADGESGLIWRVGSNNRTVWTSGNDGTGSGLDADTVDGLQASQFLRNDADSTIQAVLTTRRISVQANHDIRFTDGNWTGNTTSPKIQAHSNYLYIVGGSGGIIFRENATDRWHIEGSGHFIPKADSTYDIGTTGVRVANGYFDTLYGDGQNITGSTIRPNLTFDGNHLVVTQGTSGGATANTDASLILHNNNNNYIQILSPNNKEQGILFGDDADNDVGNIIYDHSDNALTFATNGGTNERARFTSAGQFVMGTTSSTGARVIIQQDSSDTNPLDQQTCADSSGMRLQNYSFSTGRFTALSMECCNSSSVQSASIIAQSVASGTSPDIIIAQRTSNTANTERLRIKSDGSTKFSRTASGVDAGTVLVNTDYSNYGVVCVRDKNATHDACLQAENENTGNNEYNRIYRSVNRNSTEWANAALCAKSHVFRISGGSSSSDKFFIQSDGVRCNVTPNNLVCNVFRASTGFLNYGVFTARDASSANVHNAGFQVENPSTGSDTTNQFMRSVDLNSANWANAKYSAKAHRFLISGSADTTKEHRITSACNLITGRNDGNFTYNDTNATNNTISELYGGTVAGNRGILSLAGRTGSNNGDLGTIWFVNGNNSGTSPGNNMRLAAAIQSKSYTTNSNASSNSGAYIQFYTKTQGGSLTERFRVDHDGHLIPNGNNNYDLGSSSSGWRNLYVNDAHFSNKGGSNSVDGTWGDWTLQEGENDIFMINNRTGKKFAITMREVS